MVFQTTFDYDILRIRRRGTQWTTEKAHWGTEKGRSEWECSGAYRRHDDTSETMRE